jgi:hypothetical protein
MRSVRPLCGTGPITFGCGTAIPTNRVVTTATRLAATNYSGVIYGRANGVNLPAVDAHGAFINGVASGTNFTIKAYGRTGKLINPTHPIFKNEQFGYSTTEYYPKPTLAYGFVRWTDPLVGGGAAWFDSAGNLNIVYGGFGNNTLVVKRVKPITQSRMRMLRPMQGGHGVVTWPGTCGTAAANLAVVAAVEAILGGVVGMAGAIDSGDGPDTQVFGNQASQGMGILTGVTGIAFLGSSASCPPSSTTANGGILMSGPDVTDAIGGLGIGGTFVAGADVPDGGGIGEEGSNVYEPC